MKLSAVEIGDIILVQYTSETGLRSLYWIVTEIVASDYVWSGMTIVTLDIRGYNLWTKRIERIFEDHHNCDKPQLQLFRNGEKVIDKESK